MHCCVWHQYVDISSRNFACMHLLYASGTLFGSGWGGGKPSKHPAPLHQLDIASCAYWYCRLSFCVFVFAFLYLYLYLCICISPCYFFLCILIQIIILCICICIFGFWFIFVYLYCICINLSLLVVVHVDGDHYFVCQPRSKNSAGALILILILILIIAILTEFLLRSTSPPHFQIVRAISLNITQYSDMSASKNIGLMVT